jgi:hypothetical protein
MPTERGRSVAAAEELSSIPLMAVEAQTASEFEADAHPRRAKTL